MHVNIKEQPTTKQQQIEQNKGLCDNCSKQEKNQVYYGNRYNYTLSITTLYLITVLYNKILKKEKQDQVE